MKTRGPVNASAVNFARRQCGASLLEGIAYLGIAALVILGAVSLLTGAFSSAQSNRGAEEIVSIRTAVKKLYMGQANSYVAGPLTASLNTAKLFPTTLALNAAGTAMTNSWGGDVTVTGAGSTFLITYTGVPQEACISMISGASGWSGISGNGGAEIAAFPLTPVDAARICSVATAAGNSVVLTSR